MIKNVKDIHPEPIWNGGDVDLGSTQDQECQGHPSELLEKPFKTAKVANVLSGNYPETILNLSGMGVMSTWGRPRIKNVKDIHQN